MRVLLDSNLPSAFAALLPGHRTETTHTRRWSDLDDGPLLDAAEREYDAFVRMDQSLRFLSCPWFRGRVATLLHIQILLG